MSLADFQEALKMGTSAGRTYFGWDAAVRTVLKNIDENRFCKKQKILIDF